MIFLWPLDEEDDNPSPGVVRCGFAHPAVCTDYIIDWMNMRTMSVGFDCRVVLFDLEKDKMYGHIKNDGGTEIQDAFLCIDGDFDLGKVAVGTCGGLVKIADLEAGKIVYHLKGHWDDVYSVKCDWNKNQCVSGAWDRKICTWDLRCAH